MKYLVQLEIELEVEAGNETEAYWYGVGASADIRDRNEYLREPFLSEVTVSPLG